jgi:hypothetical protein
MLMVLVGHSEEALARFLVIILEHTPIGGFIEF